MSDLPALVPALAAVLVDFLWQGALIGLFAWLALSLLRNARPQARYAVACLALLACVLVPAWRLLQAVGASASPVHAEAFAPGLDVAIATAHAPAVPAFKTLAALPLLPDGVMPWVVVFWAAGVVVLALRMACGLWWVRRLRARALADRSGWQQRLDALAQRMGIGRVVALKIVADGDSPLSAGWWKPVVLLPAALAMRMPTHLLEALLAHELAHIRRHDYLVNLLQGTVEALLFYHPVTWWLSRRIRIEREQVADDIAASALQTPRHLALALSQLDRYATPFPAFAQAAHGGQLMSRIQQLVRPDRRTIGAIGGIVALPLLGLAAAGLVFAQVHSAPIAPVASAAPTAPTAPPAPAAPPAPPAPTVPLVHPAPAPTAPVAPTAPTPPVAPTSPTAPAAHALIHVNPRGDGRAYALVRKGREGITMSGDDADVEAIRAARRSIDGDFIWFRRDGKPYVVRDEALQQRAEAAWAPTQALEARMQALDARMRPHQEQLEALGKRMEAIHVDDAFESPETRAAAAKMEALGERMQALALRQEALAQSRAGAAKTDHARLQQQAQALSAQQERLAAEMEQHSRVMEAAGRRMQAQSVPMEALARQMEAASKPMQSVGKEMEALGRQMEQKAAVADGRIQELIDEAVNRGLAQPAPAPSHQ